MHDDISHGKEIPEKTFYFYEHSNITYSFKELVDELIKLINSNKRFKVDIKPIESQGTDVWLQVK